MSQELEIEFKNLLTKEEYLLLRSSFHTPEQEIIIQQNHYFDTPLFHLKDNEVALRIREKNGEYYLTLKQPVEEGVLETHQSINALVANEMMMDGGLVSGEVHDLLVLMNIPVKKIVHFGSLKTNRVEVPYESGILVMDHSYYFTEEDFELEYEVTDRTQGEKSFTKLLSYYKIPVRKTDSKIKRFYKAKIRQN